MRFTITDRSQAREDLRESTSGKTFMYKSRSVLWTFGVWLSVLVVGNAFGQDYPNKPIRIVTGPSGGGGDFTARLMGPAFSESLGQPVVVDNRTGVIQGEVVAKAAPDGYTLFVAGSNVWVAPLLGKTPYDVVRDFAPVSLIQKQVLVLSVYPAVPVKNIRELIELAKAKPGELNYASSAIGGAPHLAAELLKTMADVNIVRVPYKSVQQALTDLVSGRVQMAFSTAGEVAPFVKAGKLRALAVSTLEPSLLAPGLPTIAATGLPGYDMANMVGMFAPASTPASVISRVNQEIVRFLGRAEVKEQFLKSGVETVGSSPEQFMSAVKSDMIKLGKVIKDANIKPE